MSNEHVTVIYKWTAKEGKLSELSSIYASVVKEMEANEPGAEAVHLYTSEEDNSLYVRDEFADAGAVGFHLQNTAAAHFNDLLAIATPGTFYFWGELPAQLKEAVAQMGLQAEFAAHSAGFDR